MKFWLSTIILLLSFGLLVYSGWYWWNIQLTAVNTEDKTDQTLVIANNESANSVLQKLVNQNVIRNYWVAKLYLQGQGLDQKLKPGSYVISRNLTLSQISEALTQGPKDVWVTIPEGFRREQIAQKFASFSQFDVSEFIQLTATLEGKLFPDTYLVPLNMNTSDVIKMMSKNFATKVGEISNENLILASLVEREVRIPADRKMVAGIIKKRLDAGWPLQIDATIQYVVDSAKCQGLRAKCEYWKPITDTKFVSNYNTYLNIGLPPTPIANPGIEAINAVLKPESSDYWYYLSDDLGVTHYAKDLREHNLNIDKYLND